MAGQLTNRLSPFEGVLSAEELRKRNQPPETLRTTNLARAGTTPIGPQKITQRELGGAFSPLREKFRDAGLATSDLENLEVRLAEQEEDIREAEARRLEQRRGGIETRFGETIEKQREIGEAEVSGTRAQLAISRGAGASSSRLAFIADQQKQNDRLIKEFETAKEQALLGADTLAADRETIRINALREQNFKLRQQAFNETQAILTGGRAERGLAIQERAERRLLEPLTELEKGVVIKPGERIVSPVTGEVIFEADEIAELQKPITVGAGQSLVDATGKVIFQSPQATKPIVVGKGASLVDPVTGDALFSPQSDEAVEDEANIDNFAKNILQGVGSIGNVPTDLKIDVSNKIRQLLESGFGNLTPEQKIQLDKITDDLRSDQSYKDMLDVQSGFQSVEVGASFNNGPGDLTMVNGFQRMIDPGAVVREGEFRTVADAQGWLQKMLNIPQRLLEGDLLKPEARQKLLAVAVELYNRKAQRFNETAGDKFRRRAEIFDLPFDIIGAEFPLTEGEIRIEETLKDEFNNLNFDTSFEDAVKQFGEKGLKTIIENQKKNEGPVSFRKLEENLPQRNKNPGNVKVGGIADQFAVKNPDGSPKRDNQGHLIFPDEEAGFKGLRADVKAKVEGRSRFLSANPTLTQLGSVFAEDPNWTKNVASILGIDINTKTQSINFENLIQAIARQEGFFA